MPIFEDDYDNELRYDGPIAPALKAGDAAGQIIYAGTFSKVLFPGPNPLSCTGDVQAANGAPSTRHWKPTGVFASEENPTAQVPGDVSDGPEVMDVSGVTKASTASKARSAFNRPPEATGRLPV